MEIQTTDTKGAVHDSEREDEYDIQGRERKTQRKRQTLPDGVKQILRNLSYMSHVSLQQSCQRGALFLGEECAEASWKETITTNSIQHAAYKERHKLSHSINTRRKYRKMSRHHIFC